MTTATREDIVWWWIGIDDHLEALRYNWGTQDRFTQAGMWDVTDATYINGVPLMLDGDYYMGYLLEVMEHDSDAVSYVAIALYHGKCNECGYQAHDSMWFEPGGPISVSDVPGTQSDAAKWAIGVIYGMWENADDGNIDGAHAPGCTHAPQAEASDDGQTAEATA